MLDAIRKITLEIAFHTNLLRRSQRYKMWIRLKGSAGEIPRRAHTNDTIKSIT